MSEEPAGSGTYAQLCAATDVLNNFFYKEVDGPNGRYGNVTPKQLYNEMSYGSFGFWFT